MLDDKQGQTGHQAGAEGPGRPLIFAAMSAVMRGIGAIGKDRKAQTGGAGSYNFRGIDDIYNACHSVMGANGVFCVPRVVYERAEDRQTSSGKAVIYRVLTMEYTFYAADGSSVQATTMGEAMDSGDKATNKAMSAAQKYAFLQVFCIPTEELKDSENDTYELAGRANEVKKKRETTREEFQGAMAAAKAAAPNLQAKKTPTIYNHEDQAMQQKVAKVLFDRKVDESLWEEIGRRLHNRPSSDMNAIIADVKKEAQA